MAPYCLRMTSGPESAILLRDREEMSQVALGQTFILGHGSARLLLRGGSKLVDEAEAVRWLRRSYRYAAFVDAIAAVGMIHPKLYEPMLRFDKRFRRTGPEFTYAMRTGAPLMAGWTVLLMWADRKPLERRGVLLITLLPVVAGTMANDASAVRAGHLSGRSVAPVRALQLFLVGLCAYSLARARAAVRAQVE